MRVLILNLRDIRNPQAGGAEIFTHAVAKRWVREGHQVTWLVSGFPGGKSTEALEGVEVIRLGSPLTVFALAKRCYRANLRSSFDLVIDEYTLRPFFANRFVDEPVLFLAHELAREKFFYSLPPVLSHVFYYLLEPSWLRAYQHTPTITVSESTRRDLADFGFDQVHLVSEGIDFAPLISVPSKDPTPTMIYVGLLKKSNIVGDVIAAFREISKFVPNARLWIVGRGEALSSLRKEAQGTNTTFFGYVPEQQKLELLMRANILLVPAVREGWCLVVTEAAACGTPAVGYRVPGLVDSIRHGKTGLLTDPTPQALAQGAIALLRQRELQLELAENALQWSRGFSWDKTASQFMRVAEEIAEA